MTRLISAGDPRAKHVSLDQEPGLRLPPEDDPDRDRWKARWEQYLRNRAVLSAAGDENTGAMRTVKRAIEWLERRGAESEPFVLWLDLFSPHGPWDPPQPFREQYVTVEPDEFETGDEGELVEDRPKQAGDEIDIGRCRRPDRRPGRRGRRRPLGSRAVPAAAHVRRHGHLCRPLSGRAVPRDGPAGPDGRHLRHLHQRPGRAAGRARLRAAIPALALRRADSHAADHPPARRPARRKPPSGARADRRPAPDDRFGPGLEADRRRRGARTATTCSP